MPCWVVPTIAAEYWRVPLEQVQDRIDRFAVPIRRENGFTFIDILPDPPSDKPMPRGKRPATFTAAPAAAVVADEGDSSNISHNPVRLQTATLRRRPVAA